MLSIREVLKQNRLVQAINKAPFLQRKIYSGTSGIGVCSTNIVSYVHVFNSLGFFENNQQPVNFSMTIGAEANANKTPSQIKFSLGFNESKVVRLNDYFSEISNDPLFVSYRCQHDFAN